jgi:hypothetical protein
MRVPIVRELAPGVDEPSADDPFRRETDAIDPGLDGLLVSLEDRHPEQVVVDPPFPRHELVGPGDGVRLEIVAEGEVAQHLEERLVSSVPADVLDVVGPHHLLAGHGARVGSLCLAEEERDELVHARVREQEPRLRRRDQR